MCVYVHACLCEPSYGGVLGPGVRWVKTESGGHSAVGGGVCLHRLLQSLLDSSCCSALSGSVSPGVASATLCVHLSD